MAIHSSYGGSVIGRIIACWGYPNATRHIKNLASAAAELGTAAHECGEYCIKTNTVDARTLIGCDFNGHEVDEEMADAVNIYIQYIRTIMLKYPTAQIYVEPKVTMSSVHKDEVFGYVDCLILVIVDGILFIIDYKHGLVEVNVNDNAQIAHYAISALDTYNLWFAVKKVIGAIVQPRMEHSEGVIRSIELTIDELMEWRDKIVEAIRESKKPDAGRTAGTHCVYCPARGECRTRILWTMSMAMGDKPFGDMLDHEIALILPEIPAMKKNLEAIQLRGLELARAGVQIDGYKLVRASKRAECSNPDEFKKALQDKKPDVDLSEIYWTGKMKGKTELKKHFDKKTVDKFFPTPDASSTLVPLSNAKSAIATNATQAFKGITI